MQTLGALIFPGFELLDLYGPLEMFGLLPERVEIRLVAEAEGPVASGAGPRALADDGFAAGRQYDLLLVPGGPGTRREVDNERLIGWLRRQGEAASQVATVCTGSALLARTGLLDGRKATSNKAAFDWVVRQGPAVDWQASARWVEDGKFWTSSGVSAGTDMALAWIARLWGRDTAEQAAVWAEYHWQSDPTRDAFAARPDSPA